MTAGARWTLDALVEAYTQHCRRTRGLRDRTLREYGSFARLFVGAALGDGPIDPTCFLPSAVVAFVASLRERFSPRSMKTVRTALRSFFRFLRVEGLCDEHLEGAIPTVAYWRLSTPSPLRKTDPPLLGRNGPRAKHDHDLCGATRGAPEVEGGGSVSAAAVSAPEGGAWVAERQRVRRDRGAPSRWSATWRRACSRVRCA
jgi:hypothetical protein